MEQNPPAGSVKTLTFGENAVGLTFNPSGDQKVQQVKELYAKIIDLCNEISIAEPTYTEHEHLSFRAEILHEAIKSAMSAQMWAVKGITYKTA